MKKVFILFITTTLIISSAFYYAFAAPLPKLIINNVSATVGKNITIPVKIENNPGLIAACINISYDKDYLQLEKVDNGTVFPASTMTSGDSLNKVPYKVLWEDATARKNYTGDGTLVSLQFKVIKAPPKDKTEISISVDKGSTFDINLNDVSVSTGSAIISIVKVKGDINFDGKINSTDALFVLQCSVGIREYSSKEFETADVNNDKKLNSTDALIIMNYSIGIINKL